MNYAGRRPMLLALIVMATFTFGLLFSGWLTPTPGKAQGNGGGNPTPNVETNCGLQSDGSCVECGPHLQPGWYLDSYPTLNNTPSVSPADECAGTLPSNLTLPTYSSGSKHQNSTYDCSTEVDQTPGSITWTAGSVYWSAAPNPVTDDYTLTAYVDMTSSDPSLCAGPTKVTVGSCLFHVNNVPPPPPSIPQPNPRTITLTSGGSVNTTKIDHYSLDGYYDWQYVVSGTAGPSYASESFKSYASLVTSLCGYGINQRTYPDDPGFSISSIDLDVDLEVAPGVSVGFGVSIDSEPTMKSFNLFGTGESPDTNYVEWTGQPWEGDATPTTTSFSGTVVYEEVVAMGPNFGQVVGTPSTYTYTGQSLSILNPTDHVHALYDTVSHTKCCPNNPH